MRLIDADELKEVVFSKTDGMEDLWDTAGVLNLINNAPTVDVTALCPVDFPTADDPYPCCSYKRPRGEWIEKVETKQLGHGWLTTHEIVCSVCGESGENDENIPQCWKFCPNCGAKMGGEEP